MQEDSLQSEDLIRLSGDISEDIIFPNPLRAFIFNPISPPSPRDLDFLLEKKDIDLKKQSKQETSQPHEIPKHSPFHDKNDQNEPENSMRVKRKSGRSSRGKSERRASTKAGRAKSTHVMTTRLKKRSDPWFNADVQICCASEALAALSLSNINHHDSSLSLRFNPEILRLKNRPLRRFK